jgi:hypothetical protein
VKFGGCELSKSLNVAVVGMMYLVNTSILSVLPSVKKVAVDCIKGETCYRPFCAFEGTFIVIALGGI